MFCMHENLFPGNMAAFDAAKDRLKAGRLSAFVGAGASMPIRPTWSKLMHDLLQRIESQSLLPLDHILYLKELINSDILEVASQVEKAMGKNVLRPHLAKKLSDSDKIFTDVQMALIELPFDILATTNYDMGLESAYAKRHSRAATSLNLQQSYSLTKWNNDEIAENERPILHLHGDTSDPYTWIFSKEDYFRCYKEEEYVRCLVNLWTKSSLFIVGFGFNDPFLGRLAEVTLRSRPMEERHFAIIGSTKPIQTWERQIFIDRYRINPIFYLITENSAEGESHSQLAEYLGVLFANKENVADERSSVEVQSEAPREKGETGTVLFEKNLFVNKRGKTIYVEPQIYRPSTASSPDSDRERVDIKTICYSGKSYFISGRSEYGRTTCCFAIKSEIEKAGMSASYHVASSLPNYKKKLSIVFEAEIASGNKPVLIVDDFNPNSDMRIIKEIEGMGIFSNFIIFTNYDNLALGSKLPEYIGNVKFDEIQMLTMKRADVRALALIAFDTSDEDHISHIVEKVYGDLTQLCIPLTPSNIILYLQILNVEDTFTPVNRIQIAERYLSYALRASSDAYSDSFHTENKYDLISCFVFELMSKEMDCFTESDWESFCRRYSDSTLLTVPSRKIWRDLRSSRVLVNINENFYFKYRLFYTFFVGHYLASHDEKLKEMLSSGKIIAISNLAEVVSARPGKSALVLEELTIRLENTIAEFQEEFIEDEFDPFGDALWPITDKETSQFWEPLKRRLENGPKKASEIDEIRTNLELERSASNQNVLFGRFEEVENRLVRLHIELAKALKNADGVGGAQKIRTAAAVLKAHKIVYQVAFLLAPIFMKYKFYYWFGILFVNNLRFREDAGVGERISIMLQAIEMGALERARDVLGTKKLGLVYGKVIDKYCSNGFERTALFGIVIRGRQDGWFDIALDVVKSSPNVAYYLSSMLEMLEAEFSEGICTAEDRSRIEKLIAAISLKRGGQPDLLRSRDVNRAAKLLRVRTFFANRGDEKR